MTDTNNTEMDTIGVIGLGLLGGALAARLCACHHDVIGYDIDSARCTFAEDVGVTVVDSAQAVFQSTRRVVLSLPTSAIVTQVLENASTNITSAHIIIDTTTGEPAQMMAIGQRVTKLGATYLDASVAGSSELARRGEVVMLVGGDDTAFAECADVFRVLARQAFHVGPTGSGAKLKLVHNLILGLHRAVLAEGLCFAEALDLNGAQTLAILKDTVAYSKVMDLKGDKMVTRDFTPQATLAQHLKDVRIMCTEGERLGQSLPLTALHYTLLEQANALGLGTLDNSAILRMFERNRGPS